MKLSKIKLKEIKPAEYNPRKISDSELEKLNKSLEKFGFVDPIIINLKNNKIIGGHQRYKILIESDADKKLFLLSIFFFSNSFKPNDFCL